MSSKHKSLHDLFHHQVKDLYYAERHAGKILLKMAKAATSESLRQALEKRHDDTATAIERLETLFEIIDKKAQGVPCEAMQGIIEETKSLIDDFDDSPVLDAGLAGAALAIEHYSLARYSALKVWAVQIGLESARAPIDASLADAKQAIERWVGMAGSVADAEKASTQEPMTVKTAALVGLR